MFAKLGCAKQQAPIKRRPCPLLSTHSSHSFAATCSRRARPHDGTPFCHAHNTPPLIAHTPSPLSACFCAPHTSSCAHRRHARPTPPTLHPAPHFTPCTLQPAPLHHPYMPAAAHAAAHRTLHLTPCCAQQAARPALPNTAPRDACLRCERPPASHAAHHTRGATTHAHCPAMHAVFCCERPPHRSHPHTPRTRPAASACHLAHCTPRTRLRHAGPAPPRTQRLTRAPATPLTFAAAHGRTRHTRRPPPPPLHPPLPRPPAPHPLPRRGRSFMLRAPIRHASHPPTALTPPC